MGWSSAKTQTTASEKRTASNMSKLYELAHEPSLTESSAHVFEFILEAPNVFAVFVIKVKVLQSAFYYSRLT